MVLVEYTDLSFTVSDPHDYFYRMLNEDGFSDLGATGCAAEYFRLNSSGVFRPKFDVYGPVKLPRNMSYYGGNNAWGNDAHLDRLVTDALDILDPEVDFSQYDCDGDGVIDNVFIFYAGRGESSGGGPEAIWPQSNTLANLSQNIYEYDGVRADRFACSNEWKENRPDGVGTFIHEFSHVMGLPDLYATTYTSSFSPGTWSALDYGPYNNSGMTPPLYGAFERYALGWMEPREIDRAVSATLPPVGDNVAGIIRTSRDTEFFLVENRQQTGWDEYIPGHGMLIWHIDYNESIWKDNKVNNTPAHQYVDIEEADGSRTESTRAGDAFPGTSGNTSFTATTRPSMTTWAGMPVDFPMTEITETPDGMITFNILGGASTELPAVQTAEAAEVTHEGFRINWTPAEGCDHLVSVYTVDETSGTDPVYVDGYKYLNVGAASTVEVKGLEPETEYRFRVTASNGWVMGEPGEEKQVTTDRLNLSYRAVTATEPLEVGDNSFTATWEPLVDADRYMVTVYIRQEGEPYSDICDFSDEESRLPDGWSATTTIMYGIPSYCGNAVPSLRLGLTGDYMQTPVYSDGLSAVSFWHRGNREAEGSALIVSAYIDGEWSEIENLPVVTEAGGAVSEVALPEGTTAARIAYKDAGKEGMAAIDDIVASHGRQFTYQPLESMSSLDAGSECSLVVSGLESATGYGYTVRGTDGTYVSLESNLVEVMTGGTAVGMLPSEHPVNVVGNHVICHGAGTVLAYDLSGRVVANGRDGVELPHAGMYIVRMPQTGAVYKIVIR